MDYMEYDEREYAYQDEMDEIDEIEEAFRAQEKEVRNMMYREMFEEEYEVQSGLLANLIGKTVLSYLKSEGLMREMFLTTENHAVEMLQQILSILKDDRLDDPKCFKRIEEILRVFEGAHISTRRHDFG